jgi:hypothetical protein
LEGFHGDVSCVYIYNLKWKVMGFFMISLGIWWEYLMGINLMGM